MTCELSIQRELPVRTVACTARINPEESLTNGLAEPTMQAKSSLSSDRKHLLLTVTVAVKLVDSSSRNEIATAEITLQGGYVFAKEVPADLIKDPGQLKPFLAAIYHRGAERLEQLLLGMGITVQLPLMFSSAVVEVV